MSKFARACILSYEEWVATIPEELPKPEYSKRHIRRMNALKNKMDYAWGCYSVGVNDDCICIPILKRLF